MSSIGGSGGTKPPGKKLDNTFNRTFLNKKIIMLIPFIMLGVTMITTLIKWFESYSVIYNYLSQIIGYSILTNLFFLKFANYHRFCLYSKVSIWSLLILNLLAVLSMALGISDDVFYMIFDSILVVCMMLISTIKFLKEVRN